MKLLIAQPIIPSYRHKLFKEVAKHFDTTICSTQILEGNGYKEAKIPNSVVRYGKLVTLPFGFVFQTKIISTLLRNKPDALFITANLRNLSFWFSLLASPILNTKIYSHGQGLYNHENPSVFFKLAYLTIICLSHNYLCYTSSVRDSLLRVKHINRNKLYVLENTIINDYPIETSEKPEPERKILYIGRLRDGCNIDLVLCSMALANSSSSRASLDIIGGGDQLTNLKEKYGSLDWVTFHGEIYEDKAIAKIAEKCTIGVYGGNAGLSVVHYMSLSLIPVIHSNLYNHMGPEPSYIIDGFNGFLFEENNPESLSKIILNIFENLERAKTISENAFQTYQKLTNPSMHEKLINVLKHRPTKTK